MGVIGVVIAFVSTGLIRLSGSPNSFLGPTARKSSPTPNRGYLNKDSTIGFILMTLIGFIQWPWLVLFSTYLQLVQHLSVTQSAAAAGFIGVGFIVASLGGYIGDTKIDRRLLMAVGSIVKLSSHWWSLEYT
jgi:hypothetical protein